jgi:dTDP-4-dehydrorhamnose reductase
VLPSAIATSADIADPVAVAACLDQIRPDIVVNAAGKTGRPNVDWCESHRAETIRANVTGALVLMDACLARDTYLVHLSSGCVFEGDKDGSGFTEEDPINFRGSFYARSKTYAEQVLQEFPVLILRPRMPFDDSLHTRSLIGKLVRYSRVLDEPNSFTYLPDFLTGTYELIERRATGIYHVVNPGISSPLTIMQRYQALVDPQHDCERLTVEQLSEVAAVRRSNCVLSIRKLTTAGITMRPIDDAIDQALNAIAKSVR